MNNKKGKNDETEGPNCLALIIPLGGCVTRVNGFIKDKICETNITVRPEISSLSKRVKTSITVGNRVLASRWPQGVFARHTGARQLAHRLLTQSGANIGVILVNNTGFNDPRISKWNSLRVCFRYPGYESGGTCWSNRLTPCA